MTVNYSTANGSARSGLDYVAKSGTLTFAPNQTSKTISVNILDDNLTEGIENFFVNLSNPSSNATIADSQGIVRIVELLIDPDPDCREVFICPIAIDFDSTIQTINFAPEETSKTITLPITNDNLVELDENFILSLTDANNAEIGTQNTAVVTILDNETSDESGETILPLVLPDGVDFDQSQGVGTIEDNDNYQSAFIPASNSSNFLSESDNIAKINTNFDYDHFQPIENSSGTSLELSPNDTNNINIYSPYLLSDNL